MKVKRLVMNKLSSIFRIHPITFIYLIIALYGGFFKNYFVIFFIVLFHEMCHLMMAYFFNFRLGNMVLLPFGAFLEIKDYGNYHVLKELLVSLMGPLSHIILFAFIKFLNIECLGVNLYYYSLKMNLLIMLFNSLPIYPLDGSKICTILLSYLFPYKLTLIISGLISVISLLMMMHFYVQIESLLIYIFLIIEQFHYFKHYQDIYLHLVYLRNRYVTYHHIKLNKGYSLFRPYYNIYVISKREDD